MGGDLELTLDSDDVDIQSVRAQYEYDTTTGSRVFLATMILCGIVYGAVCATTGKPYSGVEPKFTVCPVGHVTVKEGSKRECKACENGKFVADGSKVGLESCIDCDSKTSHTNKKEGATNCTRCPQAHHPDAEGTKCERNSDPRTPAPTPAPKEAAAKNIATKSPTPTPSPTQSPTTESACNVKTFQSCCGWDEANKKCKNDDTVAKGDTKKWCQNKQCKNFNLTTCQNQNKHDIDNFKLMKNSCAGGRRRH